MQISVRIWKALIVSMALALPTFIPSCGRLAKSTHKYRLPDCGCGCSKKKKTSSMPPCPRSPRQSRRRHPDPFQCFASMQPEPSKRNTWQTFGCSIMLHQARPPFPTEGLRRSAPSERTESRPPALPNELRCLALPRRESLLHSEACGH